MTIPDAEHTVVHLLRHGEVHNPEGVLYGRRSGFHLSSLGITMAERVAATLGDTDVVQLVSSPLERAMETAAPLAAVRGLTVHADSRLLEATNVFEGKRFARGDNALRSPSSWRHLWNPFRPSWGEPYAQIAARMKAAIDAARDAARGHQAVLVSHQLPIWIARSDAEGRRFLHDPRQRECALASLTSLHFIGDTFTGVDYAEPAGDLLPDKDKFAPFSTGDAPEELKP
jgi:broad specificity phosphatase PhoE